MNPFMIFLSFLAILAALMGQGSVSAMPLAVRPDAAQPAQRYDTQVQRYDTLIQREEIPIPRATSPFLPHNPEHRLEGTLPPVPPNPALHPIEGQAGNDETIAQEQAARESFAETHPAEIIAILASVPLAVCIMLYLFCKWIGRRKAAAKEAALAKRKGRKSPSPGSPDSPYLNNSRLEPLLAQPQMVYVPPTRKDGMRPIFGHFRSSSGNHVYGVTDRWVISEKGAVYGVDPAGSSESLPVHKV